MADASLGTARDSSSQAAEFVRAPAAPVISRFAGLVWTLVRTDFKARYHGTLSGFVWALLKPLDHVRGVDVGLHPAVCRDPTYKLDLIIGLFLWDFFTEGTKAGLVALHAKGFLLTKARFPSWILVVTSISNALITLVVFCAIIVLVSRRRGAAARSGESGSVSGSTVRRSSRLSIGFALGGQACCSCGIGI